MFKMTSTIYLNIDEFEYMKFIFLHDKIDIKIILEDNS